MAESLPTKGKLVSDTVKQVFKDRMDELLVDLGRTITLHLAPSVADCPNCSYDSIRKRSKNIYNSANPNPLGSLNKPFTKGKKCPVCNAQGVLKTQRSTTYTATISSKFKEKEVLEAGIGEMDINAVKTSTVIGSYNDILNTKLAIIDDLQYRPLGKPTKSGLQELIRVKMFWERAE
jgi:hypothetical protein